MAEQNHNLIRILQLIADLSTEGYAPDDTDYSYTAPLYRELYDIVTSQMPDNPDCDGMEVHFVMNGTKSSTSLTIKVSITVNEPDTQEG